MDQKEEVEKSAKRGSRTGSRSNRYTYDEKLRAVKLHVEEGFGGELVCKETGVSTSSLAKWTKRYREQGEMGLRRSRRCPGRGVDSRGPVKAKIVELKRGKPVLRGEADLRDWPAALVLPGRRARKQSEKPSMRRVSRTSGRNPPQPACDRAALSR